MKIIDQCRWDGCTRTAISPEVPVCADHLDPATDMLNAQARSLSNKTEYARRWLATPDTPLWRKPGRWVPVVLFLIWLGFTAYYPVLLMWWLIFMPIALIGWHWGMGKSTRT